MKFVRNEEDSYCINKLYFDEQNNLCKGLAHFCHSKLKSHIKNYHDIRSFIIKNRDELPKGRELEEYFFSLEEQYAFLLFNNDQVVELEKKSRPDNDDVFLITYFTYNLILSAKSILDRFCPIIPVNSVYKNKDMRYSLVKQSNPAVASGQNQRRYSHAKEENTTNGQN